MPHRLHHAMHKRADLEDLGYLAGSLAGMLGGQAGMGAISDRLEKRAPEIDYYRLRRLVGVPDVVRLLPVVDGGGAYYEPRSRDYHGVVRMPPVKHKPLPTVLHELGHARSDYSTGVERAISRIRGTPAAHLMSWFGGPFGAHTVGRALSHGQTDLSVADQIRAALAGGAVGGAVSAPILANEIAATRHANRAMAQLVREKAITVSHSRLGRAQLASALGTYLFPTVGIGAVSGLFGARQGARDNKHRAALFYR